MWGLYLIFILMIFDMFNSILISMSITKSTSGCNCKLLLPIVLRYSKKIRSIRKNSIKEIS